MALQEVILAEWIEEGVPAPRILGRLSDPDLVAEVRERLAAAQRRRLAALEPPVRPVADPDSEEGGGGD